MNRSDLVATYLIIFNLSKLFEGRCKICHKACTTGKYFTIHHKKYVKIDRIHSDFISRLSYYLYLEPIVKRSPKRFALLCNTHHQAVERLKRYNPDNRKRLIRLVNESV
jgi:hypothetical protein